MMELSEPGRSCATNSEMKWRSEDIVKVWSDKRECWGVENGEGKNVGGRDSCNIKEDRFFLVKVKKFVTDKSVIKSITNLKFSD